MREEGVFLYHTSCERCGSSDAKAVYSSGTAFCFSCESYFSDEEGGGTKVRINRDITTKFLGYKALQSRASPRRLVGNTDIAMLRTKER